MILTVEHGDLRDVLPQFPENCIDANVTDPPYEIGFMGAGWDRTGIAFDVEAWKMVYRVLKPGAFVVSFGGTKTWHRVACAIEDAGFEIRDSLAWLYGEGMPHSMDVSKAIDEAAGAERPIVGYRTLSGNAAMSTEEKGGTYAVGTESTGQKKVIPVTVAATDLAKAFEGWGTNLKPCFEPIVMARKPLVGTVAENFKAHGVGGLHVDACRVAGEWSCQAQVVTSGGDIASPPAGHVTEAHPGGLWPPNVICDDDVAADLDALNPRKVRGQETGVSRYFYCPKAKRGEREAGLDHWPVMSGGEATKRKEGSAGMQSGRAGAGRGGGRRNKHPTVKPLELMRWLCRLVTPPGGIILDQFTGSGTTGCAAALEGFQFAGVELIELHARLARDRIAYWAAQRTA